VIQPVVAGVDGSPESLAAAEWAADDAVRLGCQLRLIHAWPWLPPALPRMPSVDSQQQWARRMLTQAEDRVRLRHPGLEVACDHISAAPVTALLEAARDARLLVVGSRGLGGFTGLLLGSVGLAAAARADCPVVLVRGRPGTGGRPLTPATSARETAARHRPEVVAGIDARRPSAAVIAFAFEEAARRGARLRAVHAWSLPGAAPLPAAWLLEEERGELEDMEEQLLRDAVHDWRAEQPGVEVLTDVRLAAPGAALVEASGHADLVVIGRSSERQRRGSRLGAVAHAAVHHVRCPVAVVPHAD
jgi:nucleotide-binding universal stress UspA family protein